MLHGCGGCCFLVVLIVLLCCALVVVGVIYVATNAPEAPLSKNFVPSTAQAQAFQSVLDTAKNNASQQGWFWLRFDQSQLSSWMALQGENFANEHGNSFPFTDVQVAIDDGDFTFYGKLQYPDYETLSLPLSVEIAPQIDSTGEFGFDITSVDVGGVKVPDFVISTVEDQFEELLVKPFEELGKTVIFYPETLSADNGVFEVQGYVQRP